MDEKIIFTITVSTSYVGSDSSRDIEIYREDLEGVPEEEWDDYVYEKLGGKEVMFEMLDISISH